MSNQEDQASGNPQHEGAGIPAGESACGGASKEQDKAAKAACLHSCSNCQQKAKTEENDG